MAKVVSPILFSTAFGVTPKALSDAGLIDPFINVDTELFIDPVLLEKSQNATIRTEGFGQFKEHFTTFVRLLMISENRGDAPWKAAEQLLDLDEPPENGLGYSGSRRAGASRPDDIRTAIMRTANQIIKLGSKDPEMISLMGFFEEGVGPDTISDFTTRVIIIPLAKLTESFCVENGIEVFDNDISDSFKLPRFRNNKNSWSYLVLVPEDIVRALPIARDWSDFEEAVKETTNLRKRVNRFLAGIARPTVADRKDAVKKAALGSADLLEELLAAVKAHASNYDPNVDALGYYKVKAIFADGFPGLDRPDVKRKITQASQVKEVALETISAFRHHVENGNLWEELWIGNKPKRERAAQLIYYAIADCFCKANNVDISPEANMGGGPVDFKFSAGFDSRVVVELKRSNGSVKHGYEKQLEFYKTASQTDAGIFVVMKYGDLGVKKRQIEDIRDSRLARGLAVSDIVYIDATKKLSSSKRQ